MPFRKKLLALAAPLMLLCGLGGGCKKPIATVDAAPPEPEAAAPVPDAAPEAAAPDAAVEDAAPKTATPAAPTSPIAAGQAWVGNYVCQGTGAMTLRITKLAGNNVSAINEFTHHAGKSGSFNMSGTFNPATRGLTLIAGPWIKQPPGFSTVNLEGTLSADGHTIAGRVVASGCSSFNVHR